MNNTVTKDRAKAGEREDLQQFVTFTIGTETYGVDVLKVHEIIGMTDITFVPNSLPFMKGVINLRGKVIPVVDLRLRFGMPNMDYTERTCIIVVEMGSPGGMLHIGTVVDAVSEVLNIKSEDIADTPSFGAKFNADYILGMAKMGKDVKLLLDIDRVLSSEEQVQFKQAA